VSYKQKKPVSIEGNISPEESGLCGKNVLASLRKRLFFVCDHGLLKPPFYAQVNNQIQLLSPHDTMSYRKYDVTAARCAQPSA
jgi:hypothetical protein